MLDVRLWHDGIASLLDQISPSSVPSGILNWLGRRPVPDGTPLAPAVRQHEWEGHYGVLEMAAVKPGLVTPLAVVQRQLRDVPHDGPFPLALAYFRYAAPRADVVRAFTEPAAGIARPAALADAIEERTAFMASVLLPTQFGCAVPQARARAFQLILDRSLFLAPPGTPLPDEITVQAGKSACVRSVRFGDRITCVVDGPGPVAIQVTARIGQVRLTAACLLEVSSTVPAPRPDERWKLIVPGGLRGEALVYRSRAAGAERRFLILAEGFPGGHPPGYVFDQFNQHGLVERFHAKGFDLVMVLFDDGLNLMELNADVLIEALKRANAESAHDGPGHVVGGVSMGGLIARYALTVMEHRGTRHGAAVYLSLDVPHQGSRTSVSNQWFAHFFRDRVPQLRSLVHLLESPSNQQFLPQWFHDEKVFESPLRRRFFETLALMGGRPTLTHNLAVACGRGDGRTAIEPGSVMLEWDGVPFVSATLRAQAASGIPARVSEAVSWPQRNGLSPFLDVVGDGISWEGMPGSYARYNQLIETCIQSLDCGSVRVPHPIACVVPTVSALDLPMSPDAPVPPASAHASWFHDYVCADKNLGHTELTESICNWILERVEAASFPVAAAQRPTEDRK